MNHPVSSAPSGFTQLHGSDLYVRLPRQGVEGIVFGHLYSEADIDVWHDARRHFGPDVRQAGITEWQGLHGQCAVSLGWDWVQLSDGSFHSFTLVAPRSNLRLIDAKGYDMVGASAADGLWDCIAALPWKAQLGQLPDPSRLMH